MTAKREPADLSAVEAARLIATGSLTAESLMRSCLERISHREPLVEAFEHIASDEALDQARALDRIPPRGPPHGLPFAAKDNYDTFDMSTTSGSPIYAGNRPTCDACTVALPRGAGAILVGKTVTTEFAYVKPGKTRKSARPDSRARWLVFVLRRAGDPYHQVSPTALARCCGAVIISASFLRA